MSRHYITKIAVLASIAVMMVFSVTGCGKKSDQTQSAKETAAQAVEEAKEAAGQAEKEAEEAAKQAEEAATQAEEQVHTAEITTQEVLADFTGEMDLSGSWNDEVSQRATMDITANDDGSYEIVVNWAGSASEKAVWMIHGTYDPVSGMLSYEDGAYSIHTWDDKDNETVSGEESTKGAFLKEGEKLRWQDSKNSEDGLFVKGS